MSEEEIVEKVARGLDPVAFNAWDYAIGTKGHCSESEIARRVYDGRARARAAYALLRPLVLEEAAKELERVSAGVDPTREHIEHEAVCAKAAAAIRALSTSPPRT